MLKELTEESLKNHCAILGKAGSGKTYAAKGIVESLLDRGEPGRPGSAFLDE